MTESDPKPKTAPKPPNKGGVGPSKFQWGSFLGSMNLAVTLLMMLAIASVIGTVLQQNQPFQDYIIKFGPFWTQVFNSLGLFHVYGAAWFVLVLLFLLISTSVCLTRNTPSFLKDMKRFSEGLTLNAYKHQPHAVTYTPKQFDPQAATQLLQNKGYKVKQHQRDDGLTLAGMKGRYNRWGYILTHVSIIVICVGGLLDSNLLLKARELTGNLEAETRSVPVSQIPQKSWVSSDNFSFRGTVNIAEGQHADILFLPYNRGFLVQKLPFEIEVKDFRIQYYDTGMPKNYESDIVLTSPELEAPIVKTIEVNKPLYYKNYAIYQSSFGDGGSKLNLKVHPLLAPQSQPLTLDTAVNQVETINTPVGKFKIELNDFKMHNIVPASEEKKAATGKKMHNNGPSIVFKVRNDQGKAWEYENFMIPNQQDGRWFFMTGMRESAAQPFRYLFIPADGQRSTDRFFSFLALVNDPDRAQTILSRALPADQTNERTRQMQLKLMNQLMMLFRRQGFAGITAFVEDNVPAEQQKRVRDYYINQTSIALQTLYLNVLETENAETLAEVSDFDKQWFEDAMVVLNSLSNYGPPLYFELADFEHIQSTGLQITKSPGKDVVYFGSVLLIIGVFFLFYVRQKRVWLAYDDHHQTLTIAGKDTKPLPETEKEFQRMVDALQAQTDKAN